MSKQINFFLSQNDEDALADFLKAKGAVPVDDKSDTRELHFRREIKRDKNIFERFYLIHAEYTVNIKFIEINNKYHFDEQNSDGIEYWPSCVIQDRQEIRRGRLYVVTDYFDESERLIRKNDDFLKWADSVLRGARRLMSREGKCIFWYGPEALELERQGWTMSPL